jgi:carbonic anhydrase
LGVEHAKRLTAVGVLLGTLTFAGESVNHPLHWGYEGKVGPAYWGDLSPEYIMCKIGKNQSPVDINPEGLLKGYLKPIEFHYVADAKYVVNNGHTIKVVT